MKSLVVAALVAAGCDSPGEAPVADANRYGPDAIGVPDGPFADAVPPDAAPPDGGPDAGPGDPLPPIERAQAGGATTAIAIVGHRAFVGVGPRLTVWDLSSGLPSRIAETEPLAGVVNDVAVSGDHAFVVTARYGDGAFHVIDLSDETSPSELASLRLGTGSFSSPQAVVAAGGNVYVADAEQGVFRVDITAPMSPIVTAFQPVFGATHIQVAGPRLHAAGISFLGARVDAFDLGNDLAPLGSTHLQDALAVALTTDGLVLTRSSVGFAVDDLANPSSPSRIYTVQLPVWAMAPGEGGAWLTVDGDLRFLDLGDHAAITLGPAHDAQVWAVDAAAFAGDRLAFATYQGGLEGFAVGPTGPVLLGRASTGPCASCYATTSAGDMLVVAETTPGAVGTIGTSGLGDLELDGQHMQLTADFEDIAYAAGHAYVADWFVGLRAFDVTDPGHPTPIAQVPTDSNPSAIAVANGRVYLGESTNGGALPVLSSAAPVPVELGAIATGRVADLAAAADVVFVAEAPFQAPGGLGIYDVQDPTSIARVGGIECPQPRGVAVSGSVALLSCSDGVHVIDVRDPASPSNLAVWTPPVPGTSGRAIAFDGTFGYHGHDHGVTVFDVRDPSSPITTTELATAWMVRHLAVAGPGRVIASTSRGGVYQWEL